MNRQLRRRIVMSACVFTMTLLINPGFALAQDGEEVALEQWQQYEFQSLSERLNAAVGGDLPSEKPFEISVDFLKAAEGNIYVPFTLTMDPSKLSTSTFAMYLFVTPHAEPPAAGTPPPSLEETLESDIYSDLFFVEVSEGSTDDGPVEIHRAFQAPAGNYDVYIVVRDSAGEQAFESAQEASQEEARRNAAANRSQRGIELQVEELANSMVMVLKEELEVPDFWSEALQTSTILRARSLDQIDAPLSPEEQRVNPYTIGTTQIVPKRDEDYTKTDSLSLLFYVYNPQLTSEMSPDVTVEFEFHRVGPAGESFFNRTAPQEFNAQTWPAGVPVTGGLPSGQAVPLGSFPAGGFRLAIKITDNVAEQTLTRDFRFNVSE